MFATDDGYVRSDVNIISDFRGGRDIAAIIDGDVAADADEMGAPDFDILPDVDIVADPGESTIVILCGH
ncbi:MAG: hypothetical protein ABSA68_12090 [Xanthobacteraceae bacterium]|jgi:hypothetical protein